MKNAMQSAVLAAIPVLGALGCDLAPATFEGGGTWGTVLDDEEAAAGESEGSVDEPAPDYGELRVALTTKPSAEVDELWVRLDQVKARSSDSGWVIVSDEVTTVDLMSLGQGLEAELGLEAVPTGGYAGVMVRVDKAWAVVDGKRFPVEVRGTDPDGIAVPFQFSVPECSTMDMLLDWDLARGLETGARYRLYANVRVRAAEFSGSCGAAGGGGTGGESEDPTGGESEGGGSTDGDSGEIGIEV